ncbi:T3SS regulon anti-activator ExsD family protein [Pseudomonas aeruginosa]|nr:T3SS regulon anti-activator ExsD family protein [Pseudomonas aeruginosa]
MELGPSPGTCESSPNSGPAWPSWSRSRPARNWPGSPSARRAPRNRWPNWPASGDGFGTGEERLAELAAGRWPTLLASGGLAGFEPIPEVLECLWQPLCRLDDDVGAADAVQAWLHERNLCQAQDHFYWQS